MRGKKRRWDSVRSYRKFFNFILRVNTNYGSHIKLVVETFDIPCRGNNGLKIIDTSRNNRIESVNFCSKQRDSKVPMFVSTEVSFDLLLTIDSPLPVSSRSNRMNRLT